MWKYRRTRRRAVLLIAGIITAAGFTSRAASLHFIENGKESLESAMVLASAQPVSEMGMANAVKDGMVRVEKQSREWKESSADIIKNETAKLHAIVQEAETRMRYEQELLAALIFCEAGNQPYEGQVAVGAVVMNRVQSGKYPGSIEEVIYQPGQFGPAVTGWLDQVRAVSGYTEAAMQAAKDAFAGVNPIGGCLYFDRGGYGMQIGDHYFH